MNYVKLVLRAYLHCEGGEGGGGDLSTKKILERGTSSAICVLYSVYMQWVVLVPGARSSWYIT